MLLLQVTAGIWVCAIFAGMLLHRGEFGVAEDHGTAVRMISIHSVALSWLLTEPFEQRRLNRTWKQTHTWLTNFWRCDSHPPCRSHSRAAVQRKEESAHGLVRSDASAIRGHAPVHWVRHEVSASPATQIRLYRDEMGNWKMSVFSPLCHHVYPGSRRLATFQAETVTNPITWFNFCLEKVLLAVSSATE